MNLDGGDDGTNDDDDPISWAGLARLARLAPPG